MIIIAKLRSMTLTATQIRNKFAINISNNFAEDKDIVLRKKCSELVAVFEVSFRIQSKYGKIRTRKTPNTKIYYVMILHVSYMNAINLMFLFLFFSY